MTRRAAVSLALALLVVGCGHSYPGDNADLPTGGTVIYVRSIDTPVREIKVDGCYFTETVDGNGHWALMDRGFLSTDPAISCKDPVTP